MRRSAAMAVLALAGCRGEVPTAGPSRSAASASGAPAAPSSTGPAQATAPAPTSPEATAPGATPAPLEAPDAGPPLDPGTPQQLDALELGKAALASGRDGEARQRFLEAAAGPVSGASVSAGLAAAELAESAGDLVGAEALYVRLQSDAETLAEVHLAAGRFFERRGAVPKAVDAMQKAVRRQPALLPAWQSLGVLLARSGRGAEAGEALLEYETRLNADLRRLKATQSPVDGRLAVVDLLATLRDERATSALVAALRDPDPKVRVAAAGVLSEDESPEALQALAEAALAETDPAAKVGFFQALEHARARARASPAAPGTLPPPRR